MTRIFAALAWLEDRAAEFGGMAMFTMVFCVTIDVALRYSLGAPLTWSYDLVSMYLLPAIVFLPLALVQRNAHHVNVDILYLRFSAGGQRLASAASLTGAAIVIAIIGVLAARRAWTSFIGDEVISGPVPWPVWVGPALLALGAGIFVLRATGGLLFIATGGSLAPGQGNSDDSIHQESV